MILVKNLTKRYQNNIALDDISFEAQKGEILGFLGPNGAGKTTTMKILTGFIAATAGQARINDLDVANDSLAVRAQIGYLAENNPLYEDMKVYEFLRFIGRARFIPTDKIPERIREMVAVCGLKDVVSKQIGELSKGYRQRVGLAGAMIHNPRILILDEPTSGLDPNQIAQIRGLIQKIGKDKTVIFSTHILSEAEALCDRLIIINQGKIVASGTTRDILKKAVGKEIIYVKIKGEKDQILPILSQMENVREAKVKDKETDNLYGYELKIAHEVDLREYLALTAIRHNWLIFELKREVSNLEDVFRELTQ